MKRVSGLATLAFVLLAVFSFTIAAVAAPPAKPNFARLKTVSPFEIDLTWRDRSGNEDGFQIERSTNHTDFRQIARVLPGTTVYRDKNLFPGTQYFYRIRAFNASGKSRYDTASARTQTPPVPLSVAEWGSPTSFLTSPKTDLVSISAGAFHMIGLKKDGTVITWTGGVSGSPAPPTNLNNVIAVSAGDGFSLALKSDGTVVEWEYPAAGGFGGGFGGGLRSPEPPDLPIVGLRPPTNTFPQPPIILPNPPTEVPPIVPVQPVQTDSPPVIQPIQLNPQPLASPRLTTQSLLAPPDGLTNVVAISAGLRHALALKSDGTVVAWGVDELGETEVPPGLNGVVEIAAGQAHSLALRSDGTVVGWGGGTSGAGTPPTNLTSVVAIAAGDQLSAAVKSDGTIVGWGTPGFQVTAATEDITNATAVVLGQYMGTALLSDGSITNWVITGTSFAAPDLGASVVQVSADFNHFAALSTAPAAPSNPATTVLSTTQLRLTWQDNSTDEKFFAVERSIVSNNIALPWTQIATVPANQTHFLDTAVQTNFEYTYRVRAIGKFGTSPYCTQIATIVAPILAPAPLSASLSVTNKVSLAWAGGLGGIVGYKIERAPDDNGAPGAWQEIGSVNVTNFFISAFTDKTIQANNTYWYRVRAFNVLGFSPYGDALPVSVVPPLAPSGVAYSTYGSNILVYWFAGPNSLPPTGYKVETAPDINNAPGPWTEVTNIAANFGSYTDIGRIVGVPEWYRIRAYNWVGDSPYTDPLQITLPPTPTPYGLTGSLGVTPGINLHWDTTSEVDGFYVERAPDLGGSPGGWTQIALVSNNFVQAFQGSFTDTNVVANATYWYRVRAFSAVGDSDYSDPLQVTTSLPTPPNVVTLSLADRVQITWSYRSSVPFGIGSVPLWGFSIERAADASGAPGAWQEIGTLTNTSPFFSVTFIDTNALPSTIYWYRMRAFNWVGYSDYSNPASIGTFPPDAPSNLTVQQYLDSAQLYWNAPLGSYRSFEIDRAPDAGGTPGAWTLLATNSGDSETYTDTNLTANITYWYRVRASNWAGDSPYTDPIPMIVPPTAVPFGLSAWMGLTQQVELNWTEEGIVDRFELERAPDLSGTPGSWSQIAVFNSTNPDLPFSDTNVVANTTYWYRLRAHSAVGYSDYTDPIQISTVPPVDGAVDFSVALDNPVKLFWSYFGGNDIVGFSVERAPDDGGAPGAWQPIDSFVNTNHASDFSFVDTNVLANTVYWYRVRTFNWAGYSDSTIARSIGLFPPDVPYAFTVLPPNRHTVELFWSEALGFPGTFEVERAPDVNGSPGPWGLLVTTNELVYYDTNLTAFATYWYRVRAGNWVGYSGYTTPLSVTIGPPAAPFAPTATIGAATNSVDVAWTDYGADEDAFNIERAPDNNGAPGAWTELAVLPVTNLYNSISFTDTNVTAYTTNWYRVRAFNDIGNSAYSDPVSIALLPPATPKNFIGFLSLPATLTLYWNDYDPLAQGFKIERALDNNGVPGTWLEITNISGGYFESYLDESVAPNTTYWYRIRAYNWVADSAYADAIIPIPPVPTFSPQPQILTLTQTNGGMLIQWSTTAGNTDIVQASGNFTSGYTNLSPALFIGSGTTNTNYFDAGALSNSPVRYYRIQSTH